MSSVESFFDIRRQVLNEFGWEDKWNDHDMLIEDGRKLKWKYYSDGYIAFENLGGAALFIGELAFCRPEDPETSFYIHPDKQHVMAVLRDSGTRDMYAVILDRQYRIKGAPLG